MSELKLDPQRQQKAKVYAQLQRRFMLLDLIIGGLYAILWLFFGWSIALKTVLQTFFSHDWLLVAGFIAIFGGFYYIITLPLSYFTGFILPHRFEMSNHTLKGWIGDQIKGLLLGAVLGGLILEIIYAILRNFPDIWWLWAAGIMLIFSVILANLAPVLLLPIFYKIEPLGDQHSELIQRLTILAENAGTRIQGIYKFDISRRSKAANAALTGLGNTRRIILGDTLLNEFSLDEIETVIAHELGHHIHHDIPIGIAFESTSTLVGFYLASLGLNWGVAIFGLAGIADISTFPLFLLVMGVYGLVTMPIGNAFSRWRERRADQYALRTTRKGEAYAAALTRLANQNLADADPEPWIEWLLYSHPALNNRIKMATTFTKVE